MNGIAPKGAHLAVPAVDHQTFETNFIRTAVCELRFPTLYEIDTHRPPADFARALRHEYPVHALGQRLVMNPGGMDKTNAHVFTSRNVRWTINLTMSTLSIETSRYESFVDFEERISFLIDACQSFIDSDFFTRVGIRYINSLPYKREELGEWINPVLVSALASGVYGDPTESGQAIRGTTEVGGFFFQHGIGLEGEKRGYGLDYDFYAENIEVKDAKNVVAALHKREYEMFIWCLGERARAHLATAKVGHA